MMSFAEMALSHGLSMKEREHYAKLALPPHQRPRTDGLPDSRESLWSALTPRQDVK